MKMMSSINADAAHTPLHCICFLFKEYRELACLTVIFDFFQTV